MQFPWRAVGLVDPIGFNTMTWIYIRFWKVGPDSFLVFRSFVIFIIIKSTSNENISKLYWIHYES